MLSGHGAYFRTIAFTFQVLYAIIYLLTENKLDLENVIQIFVIS